MHSHIRDLLPIGTVVVLKGTEKALMIVGILPKSGDTIRDYIGVLYPEGYISSDAFLVFDHKDIELVLYRGFYGGSTWDQVLEHAENVMDNNRSEAEGQKP